MARIIEGISAQYPAWEGVLWNFGGVNEVTTEKVPDGFGVMQNYVDSSHFTKGIATVIYQTVNGDKPSIEGFGQRVHLDSVRNMLSRERDDLKGYAENNSTIWTEVTELSLRAETARLRYVTE